VRATAHLLSGKDMITAKDKKFLQHLDELELKAKCLRARVAALIVQDGKIIAEHCNDYHPEYDCHTLGCLRDRLGIEHGHQREVCYGICAEQWVLALAARMGIAVQGATLYVSKHPCRICASLIAEAGIVRVVYQEGYPDVIDGFDILAARGITVEKGPNIIYPEDAHPAHRRGRV